MLFSQLFVPERMAGAVSEGAWIQAMLDTEAALARAEAEVGVIPVDAAAEIGQVCQGDRIDIPSIIVEARRVGNPAEPLVRAMRRLLSPQSAVYVHFGATSQDILDTASMLIIRRAVNVLEVDLTSVGENCARLAEEHRKTLMVGRTLLQQAVPITFGLKAAGWLSGVTRARLQLRRLQSDALAVELGGAAGTLAALGAAGLDVLAAFARELDLGEPDLSWHTERGRIAEVASALSATAGTLNKVALDIALLSQTEVGEVSESVQGGSSTMPQKRNPVGSVLARTCALQALSQTNLLVGSMEQEHERAAGRWQAEWQALSEALAFTGGAAAWMNTVLSHLDVHPGRMRSNLERGGGLIMSERISLVLAERIGREEAHAIVREAGQRGGDERRSFRKILLDDARVREHLSPVEIAEALEAATYLGSTNVFIDRAIARHRMVSSA